MAKRLFILTVIAVMGLSTFSLVLAQEKIKIGILNYSSDQAHYVEGQKAILEQLKKEGFDETKVSFDIRDAGGSKDKVTEIAKDFIAKGVNLIIPLGTPAVEGAYKETKDIPIVFSQMFDPVGSGVAKSWESSGTNVTGASTWVDMTTIVQTLRQISPSKRIGVLFTETESMTVIQLNELKKIQDKMGFVVIAANVAKTEEAGDVVRSLVGGRVDAIFVTGGATVGKGLDAIIKVATEAKIPTSTHLPDRAEKGLLLAVAGNSYKIGELAGKKAAEVLRGKKPSDIPMEYLKSYEITINMKTAKAMGIKVPAALLRAATKVIPE